MLEIQDFRDFSITSWYVLFKNNCPKTLMVEIPEDLVIKIKSDDEDVDLKAECYLNFMTELKNMVNTFERNAFVKNNWHAPLDARMFSFGNLLKVTSVDDIFLYLTASTVILEDFSHAKGVPFYVVLRKWISIHPAAEFRCIVINNVLRGITPRDWPTFYAHFKEEGPQIIEKLSHFYNEEIKLKFPRKNYVVDIVLSYPDKPYILDFGPLNGKTKLYAFSWDEIQPLINKEDGTENIAPVFRYLETDIGIMTRSEALSKFEKSKKLLM